MPDSKPLPPKNKGSDTSNLPNLFESEVQDDSTTSKANLPNAKIYFDTDKVKINKNGKIEKKVTDSKRRENTPKRNRSVTSNLPNLFESEVEDVSTTSKTNLPNAKIEKKDDDYVEESYAESYIEQEYHEAEEVTDTTPVNHLIQTEEVKTNNKHRH